jgi:ATP-dependent Lon protease
LLPKQAKNNGVKDDEMEVTEGAMRDIVRYTREAGVRSLERDLQDLPQGGQGCCSRPTPTRWW